MTGKVSWLLQQEEAQEPRLEGPEGQLGWLALYLQLAQLVQQGDLRLEARPLEELLQVVWPELAVQLRVQPVAQLQVEVLQRVRSLGRGGV